VIANAQPYWAVHEGQMDRLTVPFLGPERSTWQYPFGSLLRSGARLAMGSDWSVSTADPLRQIEVAVNRVSDLHRDGKPLLPDERLTLDEALAAFTIGSAYVNHLDGETGTLEAGKLADFVVLDRDITAPDAIARIEAELARHGAYARLEHLRWLLTAEGYPDAGRQLRDADLQAQLRRAKAQARRSRVPAPPAPAPPP